MTSTDTRPVAEPTAEEAAALEQLYADFAAAHMAPLWTQRAGLMPETPEPVPSRCSGAGPPCTRWPSGAASWCRWPRRRAPGDRAGQPRSARHRRTPPRPCGRPSSTSAPARRRPRTGTAQTAFRFVVEGEGVWTNVAGDPVAMRRGDLLLTPGMHFHEHHNTTDHPMAWVDGLDIPLVRQLDAGFFEFGPDQLATVRRRRRRATSDCGRTPGCGRSARRAPPRRRSWPTAGSTPTPRSPPSSSWSGRGTPACGPPGTLPSGSATRPPAATRSRRSAARCTGSPRAPGRPPRAWPVRLCGRCSPAPARSRSAQSGTRSRRATCSPCRPGPR